MRLLCLSVGSSLSARVLCQTSQIFSCEDKNHPILGAHYARVYEDFPRDHFPNGRALVVTSRYDGLHFFSLNETSNGEAPLLVGSFSPGVGRYHLTDSRHHFTFKEYSDAYVKWSGAFAAATLPFYVLLLVIFYFVLACITPCCSLLLICRIFNCCKFMSQIHENPRETELTPQAAESDVKPCKKMLEEIYQGITNNGDVLALGDLLRAVEVYRHPKSPHADEIRKAIRLREGFTAEDCFIWYNFADQNGNNKIKFNEFYEYLTRKESTDGEDEELTEEHLKQLFTHIDASRKDHITFEDLTNAMQTSSVGTKRIRRNDLEEGMSEKDLELLRKQLQTLHLKDTRDCYNLLEKADKSCHFKLTQAEFVTYFQMVNQETRDEVYVKGDRVMTTKSLRIHNNVVVKANTGGTVQQVRRTKRVHVQFDQREDGRIDSIDVRQDEIRKDNRWIVLWQECVQNCQEPLYYHRRLAEWFYTVLCCRHNAWERFVYYLGRAWGRFLYHIKHRSKRCFLGSMVLTVLSIWMLVSSIREYRAHQHVAIAMEGQAKYSNVFVVLAICKGSKEVKPFMNWRWTWWPCPKIEGAPHGEFQPALYVFDFSTDIDWTRPVPQYIVPLSDWRAALHVQLVVKPVRPEREELTAVITSGFGQGLRGGFLPGFLSRTLAQEARIMSLPLAYRNVVSDETGQYTSSFQFKRSFGKDFSINVRFGARLVTELSGSIFPEGALIYQPDAKHLGHDLSSSSYLLTAGIVSSNMNVVNMTGSTQKEVYSGSNLFENEKQLVGRTYYANDGKLYGVVANWASYGGIEIFDLSAHAERPPAVGSVLSTDTPEANRVVLVMDGSDIFAVVPLETDRRYVIYNVTNPRTPYQMMQSPVVPGKHTYCLEVLRGPGGTQRIVMINDDGRMFCQDVNLKCR